MVPKQNETSRMIRGLADAHTARDAVAFAAQLVVSPRDERWEAIKKELANVSTKNHPLDLHVERKW